MFCSNWVAQRVWSSHSKILISKTWIFHFPQSILKVNQASYSSLCSGSCNCHVHTLMTNTTSPNIIQLMFSILKTICWFCSWNILILNEIFFFVSQQQHGHSLLSPKYCGAYLPCSRYTHPQYHALSSQQCTLEKGRISANFHKSGKCLQW